MQNEITATQLFRTAANLRQIQRVVEAEALPQVGDLATYCIGSDRYPARVVKVSPSGHQVTIADLDFTVASGSVADGSATYRIAFHPRADARTQIATRRVRSAARYRLQGWDTSGIVRFGYADAYRDPSF